MRPSGQGSLALLRLVGSLAVTLLVLGLVASRFRIETVVDLMDRFRAANRPVKGITIESVELAGDRRAAIVTQRRRVALRKVPVSAGAILQFSIGVDGRDWGGPGDGVTFKLHAKRDKKKQLLFTRYLDPKSRSGDRRWIDVEIPLSEVVSETLNRGSTVDLVLSKSAGFRGDERADRGLWGELRVVEARWQWPWRQRRRPPNVVLISLDTLRADRVGATTEKGSITPRLDALAADGFRFDRAYAPANHTLLSHMSLLTGLYPNTHGVQRGANDGGSLGVKGLEEDRVTLAETLQAHGYVTGAFVFDCVWLDERYGFAQGFDRYSILSKGAARAADGDILPWLDINHRNPFFLFVHFYDVHSDWSKLPYDAPESYLSELRAGYGGDFDGCGEGACATRYLKQLDRRRVEVSQRDLAYIRALYDAGVEATDHQVGRLLDTLERLGVLDDTLVVVTSDHGEEFREHGRFIHTQLYEEIARVPLIFRLPARARSVGSSDHPVELLDVMPTILDLIGIDAEDSMQGRTLLPLMRGRAVESKPVFLTGQNLTGVVDWPWKLLRGSGPDELYNLADDPSERRNLIRERPDQSKRLARLLEDWQRAAVPTGRDSAATVDTDAADLERLRALGYVD